MIKKRFFACLDDLEYVAKEMLSNIPKSAIVFLNGDLASGKTTLVKEIAKVKGYKKGVTSPTFSLEHIYNNDIFHYDLYRIEFEELIFLGIIDEFSKDGLHIIEWANDKLKSLLTQAGFEIFEIYITPKDECREYLMVKIDA